MDGSSKWLVDTDWLASHLKSPDIVIVDTTLYLPNVPRNAEPASQLPVGRRRTTASCAQIVTFAWRQRKL